jgi:hypothetical protein
MKAFEVRCADGVFPQELIGVLIGYAHARGFCIEHDGRLQRLTLYRNSREPLPPPADSAKVVSFAGARRRRGL